MKKRSFKISSALKNIIGKDLITDDFVAIFELVKNSFDANAKRVDVSFVDLFGDDPKIIISDDGKGMDVEDIEKKWLFVAYSAKKEGTENYRDKIGGNRIHAGAKGIGRFSCDRLGSCLDIYSRREKSDPVSHLRVDWQNFEVDMQDEFSKVSVLYGEAYQCQYEFSHGTVIEISKLRSDWDPEKLVKLKRSLEKLINPAQRNDTSGFSIYVHAKDFIAHDEASRLQGENERIINGKVENFLFEKLGLKTTSISVEIDEDGLCITTELYDRGQFVYRLVEENNFIYGEKRLSNIRAVLFSLNRSAKMTFTKHMGVNQVNFGSVFMYKNGFRVFPAGEERGGDLFFIDRRKQQGQSRYLGTRDVIGRIEINGDNDDFQEVSSRDGGFIRNAAFEALGEFFIGIVLRRLERYAVDVVKWGQVEHVFDGEAPEDLDKSEALKLIESLTKSDDIYDIEFNSNLFDLLSNASEKSLSTLLKNFSKIAVESKNESLKSEIDRASRRLEELAQARIDAESEADKERKGRRLAEVAAKREAEKAREAELDAQRSREAADSKVKETIFLRSMLSSDLANVVSLHHHIGISAGAIENYVKSTSKKIRSGEALTSDSFLKIIERISFHAKQISATARFATKANFNLDAEILEGDILEFLQQYIENVCQGLIQTNNNRGPIEFHFSNGVDESLQSAFRPLQITIILDGLFSNSRKAGANNIYVNTSLSGDRLHVLVRDDGKGIKKSISEEIFNIGFTTTNGSGLGLYHIAEVLKDIDGTIKIVEGVERGAGFLVTLKIRGRK